MVIWKEKKEKIPWTQCLILFAEWEEGYKEVRRKIQNTEEHGVLKALAPSWGFLSWTSGGKFFLWGNLSVDIYVRGRVYLLILAVFLKNMKIGRLPPKELGNLWCRWVCCLISILFFLTIECAQVKNIQAVKTTSTWTSHFLKFHC